MLSTSQQWPHLKLLSLQIFHNSCVLQTTLFGTHDFRPGKVDFVTHQQLTWFACRQVTSKCYTRLAHLQWNSHQWWASHSLEGNNNSWDGRSKWSKTTLRTIIYDIIYLWMYFAWSYQSHTCPTQFEMVLIIACTWSKTNNWSLTRYKLCFVPHIYIFVTVCTYTARR